MNVGEGIGDFKRVIEPLSVSEWHDCWLLNCPRQLIAGPSTPSCDLRYTSSSVVMYANSIAAPGCSLSTLGLAVCRHSRRLDNQRTYPHDSHFEMTMIIVSPETCASCLFANSQRVIWRVSQRCCPYSNYNLLHEAEGLSPKLHDLYA